MAATSYVLIPKASGGQRPIGLLGSAYRLWAKARAGAAAEWERALSVPCLAATSCVGEVWRQRVAAEQAVADGHQSVSVFWDLTACFEAIDMVDLYGRLALASFLGVIAATALNVLRGPRYITLGCRATQACYARKGIPAGDTFATKLVKAHVLGALTRFAAKWDPWRIVLVVDDFGISATGARGELATKLPQACAQLARVAQQEIGCVLADEKEAIVSSDRLLGLKVAERLRSQKTSMGQVRPSAPLPRRGRQGWQKLWRHPWRDHQAARANEGAPTA